MRARSEAWSWWKAMVRSSTAANSPTGIVMSPKVIAPFQIARLLVGERSAFLLLGLAAMP
jgi:hypothetical protein